MKRLASIVCLRWWILVSLSLLAGSAWAGPCTSTAAACTDWITVAGGPWRVLVYGTASPHARNEGITRALIMVHGQNRDADNYFRHALAGAFLANALEDTLVLAPRFASNSGAECRDTLAPDELNWNCLQAPEGWRVGGPALDNDKIAAFDVLDEILRRLARKEVFPNLRTIVVAGHSGGGQFVQRYELTNQVHERLGVAITYVVANPSSYAYLDGLRPTPSAVPSDIAAASPGYIPPPPAKPPAPFVPFSDARNCTAYDVWPYGLKNRTGYIARLTDDELKKQLVSRPTTYLLGELDILPLYGFDSSCSAGAQGPTRLARGLAYGRYVNEMHGARHNVLVVPACGHSARCMFTADPALAVIFPKQ